MTKPSIIHKRFRRATEKLLANYDLVLNTRLLDEEYELIIATSACKSVEQLNHAVNHISPFMKVSELPFIKLAVQKLCNLIYMDLLTREHHEDWFRVNVYGDLFDFTFISKSNYTTKRSECHSSVIKHLKNLGLLPNDTKDVKLDFVFSHMNSKVGDTLFCEDKKNEKESCKDRRKADYVREKCLKYWSTLLCDPGHIHHLTAFSCQFNKLELRVKATKIINGITVHIILKQVSIPHDALDGVSIAEYLVTIISLVRMVAENYEKLKIMMDITKKDDIVFAKYQSQNLFKDSSSSSQSSKTESSQSSVAESNDPDEEERKTRISQNIQAALDKFNEESMKKYFDCTWDDLNTLSDDGCL
ncbi:hypothetical protein BD408DRAFT_338216 [Parasitella parasitica]|nr:hypothetical protein BD408DRAFT_338216 [Parasitella parasitica]